MKWGEKKTDGEVHQDGLFYLQWAKNTLENIPKNRLN